MDKNSHRPLQFMLMYLKMLMSKSLREPLVFLTDCWLNYIKHYMACSLPTRLISRKCLGSLSLFRNILSESLGSLDSFESLGYFCSTAGSL